MQLGHAQAIASDGGSKPIALQERSVGPTNLKEADRPYLEPAVAAKLPPKALGAARRVGLPPAPSQAMPVGDVAMPSGREAMFNGPDPIAAILFAPLAIVDMFAAPFRAR